MPDKSQQKQRTNRVFKSLHKPLTYLGVERTLFYFVCVGAVGAFNLFNSILAGIAVFIGGFAFGHWVTNSDPAFLRILAGLLLQIPVKGLNSARKACPELVMLCAQRLNIAKLVIQWWDKP